MVLKVEQAPTSSTDVDAVDLLDASFHNLATLDDKAAADNSSNHQSKRTSEDDEEDKKDDEECDADFDAFTDAQRLKEVGQSGQDKEKVLDTNMEKDLKQGIEPQLVVSDSKATPSNHHADAVAEPKRFVSPKDFELLKVIGMGAFGKVLQVKNKKTKQVLAMKVISKRLLKRKASYVENIQAERNILTRVRHPFVVMMHASFQTKHKLFIIMDFLAGGELFLRLGREGIFLEKTAAFYLAEIILALEFLHNLGVLHRDLKPENILLGSDGHVCLTDFGLAKDFSDAGGFQNEADESRASTICGTQEYMAPEMVAHKGYGRAADYWSLGCIAYEMLCGLPPFRSKLGAKDLFRKIMSEKVKMPDGATAAACKLLKGLLNRNPHARLGAARSTMFEVGGSASLKKMEFFKHIDWDKLERKEVEPPERLPVKDDEDLCHFHDEFTSMPLPRSVLYESKEDFNPKRITSHNFRGFSFIQKDFLLPERDQAEVDKYWNSVEEDGESDSDAASSKLGDCLTEETPVEKKRPPRKRKKKKKAEAANDAGPVATPSATASVASSDRGNLDEIEATTATKAGIDTVPPPEEPEATRDTTNEKKDGPSQIATKSTPTALSINKPTPPVPTDANKTTASVPPAKPQPKQPPWQSVKTTPAAKPQPQIAKPHEQPYSLDRAKNQKYVRARQPVGTPGYMQQKQQRVVPKAGGWAGHNRPHYQQQAQPSAATWTVAHHQRIPQAGSGLANQQQPHPGMGQASSNAPKGPEPGSWAAKLQQQKKQPQPPQNTRPPPTNANSTVVPPSPSSDWRQHDMSPSPRKMIRQSDFPSLGDFPAPPTLQGNGKATATAPRPMGAWAARKK